MRCEKQMSMYDWAKREVEIACQRENPDRKVDADGNPELDYGCACYESALKAYKSLCDDGHSGISFTFTRNILLRLMDELPLTPLEDKDSEWNLVSEHDGEKIYQNKRMSSLFKYIDTNGNVRFHANNYYCIDEDTGITYMGGGARQIIDKYVEPITFPYMPSAKKYVLHTKTFLTDRKNGDYDTRAYLYLDVPDGEQIKINEFYGEVNGKWEKLTSLEFDKRVKLHEQREELEQQK